MRANLRPSMRSIGGGMQTAKRRVVGLPLENSCNKELNYVEELRELAAYALCEARVYAGKTKIRMSSNITINNKLKLGIVVIF